MDSPKLPEMLTIDGAMDKGSGQILRTSPAIFMSLGRPFRIHGPDRHEENLAYIRNTWRLWRQPGCR